MGTQAALLPVCLCPCVPVLLASAVHTSVSPHACFVWLAWRCAVLCCVLCCPPGGSFTLILMWCNAHIHYVHRQGYRHATVQIEATVQHTTNCIRTSLQFTKFLTIKFNWKRLRGLFLIWRFAQTTSMTSVTRRTDVFFYIWPFKTIKISSKA